MRWVSCLLAGLALAAFPLTNPLAAQNISDEIPEVEERTPLEFRAAQAIAYINGEIEAETIFAESFLDAIPPAQARASFDALVAQIGRAVSVEKLSPREGSRADFEVRFERAIAKGGLAILPEEENRITLLGFNKVEPISAAGDSIEKVKADLAALPGTVSAYFGPLDGGAPTLSLNADTPLGLGSTFKFYVLAALGKEIAQGRRHWDDIVPLSSKSFPSGMMQDFAQGSPHTLHTYASLMISISDNTATDQLITTIGRGRVYETMRESGHAAPELSAPFMTTRDLFLLKGGDKARLDAYASGTAEERLAILEAIETNPPSQADVFAAFAGNPVRIDVEWLSSANDIRSLFQYMRQTADPQIFGIMAINKGIGDDYLKGWTYVGYKGGSEPGVRNLTWLLTDQYGADHVLTLGWNNPNADVSTQELMTFAERILTLAR